MIISYGAQQFKGQSQQCRRRAPSTFLVSDGTWQRSCTFTEYKGELARVFFSHSERGRRFLPGVLVGEKLKTVGGSENVNERLSSSMIGTMIRRVGIGGIRVTAVTSAGEEFPSSLIFLKKPK